jgi:hypothetical protein
MVWMMGHVAWPMTMLWSGDGQGGEEKSVKAVRRRWLPAGPTFALNFISPSSEK